jgi:hypothetical protein
MADNLDVEVREIPKTVTKVLKSKTPRIVSFEKDGGESGDVDVVNVESKDKTNIVSSTIEKLKSNKVLTIIFIAVSLAVIYVMFFKKKSKSKDTKPLVSENKPLLKLPEDPNKSSEKLSFDSLGNIKQNSETNKIIESELQAMQQSFRTQYQQLEQQLIGQHNQIQQQQMYISRLERENENAMKQLEYERERDRVKSKPEVEKKRNKKEDDNVSLHNLSASELEEITKRLDMLNKSNDKE